MAKKTQLSPGGVPGKRRTITEKEVLAGVVGEVNYTFSVSSVSFDFDGLDAPEYDFTVSSVSYTFTTNNVIS